MGNRSSGGRDRNSSGGRDSRGSKSRRKKEDFEQVSQNGVKRPALSDPDDDGGEEQEEEEDKQSEGESLASPRGNSSGGSGSKNRKQEKQSEKVGDQVYDILSKARVPDKYDAVIEAGFTVEKGAKGSEAELKKAGVVLVKRMEIIKLCKAAVGSTGSTSAALESDNKRSKEREVDDSSASAPRPSRSSKERRASAERRGANAKERSSVDRSKKDKEEAESGEDELREIFLELGHEDKYEAAVAAGFTMEKGAKGSHMELKASGLVMNQRFDIINACKAKVGTPADAPVASFHSEAPAPAPMPMPAPRAPPSPAKRLSSPRAENSNARSEEESGSLSSREPSSPSQLKMPVNPMMAALLAAKKSGEVKPGIPALGGLAGLGGVKLKPVPRPDELDNSKLTNKADGRAPEENAENMDAFRQQAILDAKKCRTEASEIYPFLRVSGDWVAQNKELLLECGVTHVLNMAGTVCRNYHEDSGEFKYLKLEVIDSSNESITPFLLEAIDFIDDARRKKGCCYVHCHMGVSRSCSVAIAYVMMHGKKKFQEAFDLVKKVRPVCSPNAGFMGQLAMWEDTLNHMPSSPSLYRVAPHSLKDPHMVIKLCTLEDLKTPVKATPRDIDARGIFLLHAYSKRKFFVWQAPRCVAAKDAKAAALKYSKLMIEYLPSFSGHSLVILQDDKPGSKSHVAFWRELGVDEEDAEDMTHHDVDVDLGKYDEEYAERTAEVAEKPVPRLTITTDHHSSHSARQNDLASPNSVDSAKRNARFRVQLYAWHDEQDSDDGDDGDDPHALDASMQWDRIRHYEADDLLSESMFVLLVHDKKVKKRSQDTKHTVHEAFVWIGGDLEGKLNEEGAVARAQMFIDYCTERTKSVKIKATVERDKKESPDFWERFEAGL